MPTTLWFILVHYIWRPFLPLAQLLVLVYPGVLIFWLIWHNNIERFRRMGTRAYWIAGIGWPLTAIPLLYFRNEVFSAQWPARPLSVVMGILELICAIILIRKASGSISARTMIGLPELNPQRNTQPLMNTGIYSRTRNPLYLSHWLIILAFAQISGYAANMILFGVDCIVMPLVIRAEERELLNRYGAQFKDYMQRVPRFFPKWT
jgi:protein-S-isoprenylcysteine O-methyltransferase Ste14